MIIQGDKTKKLGRHWLFKDNVIWINIVGTRHADITTTQVS